MSSNRRTPPQFNLAFLDIMCCGFGAVVLLVMLLHGDILSKRREVVADLQAEATRIEREVAVGEEYLVSLQNSMLQTEQELVITEGAARQVVEQTEAKEIDLAALQGESQATRKHVNKLQSDLKKLDAENRKMGAQQSGPKQGQQARSFIGQGDRQYLTGLRLGGKRILLLVDASASMLDETIVNVIVRRNLDDASKKTAPKWQRATRTVEWLVANLPLDSSLAIHTFNTQVQPLTADPQRPWTASKNAGEVDRLLAGLKQVIPGGGTSLVNAFAEVGKLSPRPDNILLLTDGLPTQGNRKPTQTTVSGDERLKLFQQAVRALPKSIPVNTILFPMEGDPMAAVSFWQLGIETGGSFLTPTRDWP